MQSILINPAITKEKIITLNDYRKLEDVREYVLYSDNILEGIALLNNLTLYDTILSLYSVVYEPIDQPIYIFSDVNELKYAIKICGAYDKWELPLEVSKIITYVDLPDYVLYSVRHKKVILAGENTETASVGNSQWQREGRKLGAAIMGVPFVYQTFYSGRDESMGKIREPSSLQVYNHIVYSIRYKTPSFVAYFENNFKDSQTRERQPRDSKQIFVDYIKSVIYVDSNPSETEMRKKYEKLLFDHMINYILEPKHTDLKKANKQPRILKDLPSINADIYESIVNDRTSFVDGIIDYIYETCNKNTNYYLRKSNLLNFNSEKFKPWTSYLKKNNISHIFDYLLANGFPPKTYVKGSAKVGFADTNLCKNYLIHKFPKESRAIRKVLNQRKYLECIIMPLRIHKTSKKKLTFSPDPESGEIVAFAELFSKDLKNKKCRPIIGYCIVNTPEEFDILEKSGTKLYKALSRYVDILIIDNKEIHFLLPNINDSANYVPSSILDIKPLTTTEETAIVSTCLNQSTISSNWKICFIHTHHSSWQEFVIYKGIKEIKEKNNRVSTKVDLIMQDGNKFMIAEGKNTFHDIIADKKIQRAMIWAGKKINSLYKYRNRQFEAFVYNLHTTPDKDPTFYVEREVQTVCEAIKMGHFRDVAHNNLI